MADYGLIEGLATAGNNFISTYDKTRKYQDDLAIKKRKSEQDYSLKQAEIENKKIYYDYLKNKVQGKQGSGGKVDVLLKARSKGLKPIYDDKGEISDFAYDPDAPKIGPKGKDYEAEKGLIKLRNENAEKLATLRAQSAEKIAGMRGSQGSKFRPLDDELQIIDAKNRGLVEREKARPLQPKFRPLDDELQIIDEKNQGLIDRENVRQRPLDNKLPLEQERTKRALEVEKLRQGGRFRPVDQEIQIAEARKNNTVKPRPVQDQLQLQDKKNRGLIDLEDARSRHRLELEQVKSGKPPRVDDSWKKDVQNAENIRKAAEQGLIWDEEQGRYVFHPELLPKPQEKPVKTAGAIKPGKPGKPPPPTAYEKSKGNAMGKAVSEWRNKDRSQLLDNINKVENAIGLLSSEEGLTGGYKGLIPDAALKYWSPNSKIAQDNIVSAVQETLRPTLGAQFTEKEGTSVKQLSFDKSLPQEENLRRAQGLLNKMKAKVKYADDLAAYLDQHGGDDRDFPYGTYGVPNAPIKQAGGRSPVLSGTNSVKIKMLRDQLERNPKDPRRNKILKKIKELGG